MKQHFCTLFNTYYLSRGLALHESLLALNIDFDLHIFCFDDFTYNYFVEKKLPGVKPIALSQLEDAYPVLKEVKSQRSLGEYCWTSTSFSLLYCLQQEKLPHCTYLDADMYFYSNPEVLIRAKGEASVIITPHHYFPEYDQSATSGIYCVQYVYIENTTQGMEVLNWWASACARWCHAWEEDGKFGDQKYLDFWPYYFQGVYINRHLGAGLAPWNAVQYQIQKTGDKSYSLQKSGDSKAVEVIFFHFHGLQLYKNASLLADIRYTLPEVVEKQIYAQYIDRLRAIEKQLEKEYPGKSTITKEYFFNGVKASLEIYYRSVKSAFKDLWMQGLGKAVKLAKRNIIRMH